MGIFLLTVHTIKRDLRELDNLLQKLYDPAQKGFPLFSPDSNNLGLFPTYHRL